MVIVIISYFLRKPPLYSYSEHMCEILQGHVPVKYCILRIPYDVYHVSYIIQEDRTLDRGRCGVRLSHSCEYASVAVSKFYWYCHWIISYMPWTAMIVIPWYYSIRFSTKVYCWTVCTVYCVLCTAIRHQSILWRHESWPSNKRRFERTRYVITTCMGCRRRFTPRAFVVVSRIDYLHSSRLV